MTILVIEDEKPAADRLIAGLRKAVPEGAIAGPLRSVREIQNWLAQSPSPDLIIADIQLSDGLSITALKGLTVACPVIFLTAFEEYWMEALEANGIDYLLKPFKQARLEAAIAKVRKLEQHFGEHLNAFMKEVSEGTTRRALRIVVRKGADYVSIPQDEMAYAFSEHKMTFLVDVKGQRYLVDKTLGDLEAQLARGDFFRLNRQFIARINAVAKFRSLEKGKIRVELVPPTKGEVIVSQEHGAEFRRWMGKE